MQGLVTCLGFNNSKEGMSTNSKKIKSVLQLHESKDVKKFVPFMGFANLYSKCIPNLFTQVRFTESSTLDLVKAAFRSRQEH